MYLAKREAIKKTGTAVQTIAADRTAAFFIEVVEMTAKGTPSPKARTGFSHKIPSKRWNNFLFFEVDEFNAHPPYIFFC